MMRIGDGICGTDASYQTSAKLFHLQSRRVGQLPIAVADLVEYLLASMSAAERDALHSIRMTTNERRNPHRRRARGRV